MKFSSLTNRIKGGAADAWDLHYSAKQAKGRGEDVIVLSVGDPDFATPDGVIDKAIQALQTCINMAPNVGPAHSWLAKLLSDEDRDPELAKKHEMLAKQCNAVSRD